MSFSVACYSPKAHFLHVETKQSIIALQSRLPIKQLHERRNDERVRVRIAELSNGVKTLKRS